VAFFSGPAKHRSYPVTDLGGRLVGLASRVDALRWKMEGFEAEDRLADVLSDVSQPAAFPDTPIGEVADLMLDTGIGRIPIVSPDDGRVLGMLSRHDLLKARSIRRGEEDERSRRG
jgi:CBS domain-containing protein